jgi:hypothetical protein
MPRVSAVRYAGFAALTPTVVSDQFPSLVSPAFDHFWAKRRNRLSANAALEGLL